MAGAPLNLDLDALVKRVERIEWVESVHHLHAWQFDEHHKSLEAHVVISRAKAGEMDTIKEKIKRCLADQYDIRHSTLEFEFTEHADHESHGTSVVADH